MTICWLKYFSIIYIIANLISEFAISRKNLESRYFRWYVICFIFDTYNVYTRAQSSIHVVFHAHPIAHSQIGKGLKKIEFILKILFFPTILLYKFLRSLHSISPSFICTHAWCCMLDFMAAKYLPYTGRIWNHAQQASVTPFLAPRSFQ